MRPQHVRTLLTAVLTAPKQDGQARLPICISGSPGCAKTDTVEWVAEHTGHDLLTSHAVVKDPTDFGGFPVADAENGVAHFLPYADLAKAMNAKKPTLWFFDDIGQAAPSVQAALMQLFLAREIDGKKIPECVTFVAATNRRTDRAGVSGMLETVKDRFAAIVEMEVNLDDWCEWATENDIDPRIIAFLRFRPNLLNAWTPTADMTKSPTPRTWAFVDGIVKLGLPRDVMIETLNGAIGSGPAGELVAFMTIWEQMGNVDDILTDPTTATIPTEMSELFATVTALATRVTADNVDAALTYATRLHDAGRGEFAALLVRDSERRRPEITDTDAFNAFASGPLANLIHGTPVATV